MGDTGSSVTASDISSRGETRRSLKAILLAFSLLGAVRIDTPPPAGEDEGTRPQAGADIEGDVTQGALRVQIGGRVVECPLRHTDVKADISGFVARVRVTQTFENPYGEAIEAVYVFPLPHTAAVDEMTMVVGERRILGVIKRRAEARTLYEEALSRGVTASLLEQERPNIFTQSVGNIPPHRQVRIEIAYVDVLPYDRGTYEFHFPMVVGPRYIPGAPVSRKPETPDELAGRVGEVEGGARGREPQGTGWSPDTNRVGDASRITPPVLKPEYRTGHDIGLAVRLEAGVPIRDLKVASHRAGIERQGRSRATAVLSPADSIPNKDFVLTYKVVGDKPEMAVLTHAVPGEDGYFLLMMQPRDMEDALRKAPPRDLCFLIDVSGSMSGEPTAKVVEAMQRFFALAKPEDRIQVVTFAGDAQRLFPAYLPATPANVARALRFTDSIQGGGGTEMLKGIKAVLADPVDPQRVRIVVMLTDGYIGNEAEIIGEVGRRAGDQIRFWTIGIGSSPNRFLLDGVARQGGGMSAVLGLHDDPTELVGRIVERIHRAQLSRIEIDWGGLDVFETYPAKVPELWAGRPVVLLGRYRTGGASALHMAGLAEGEPVSFPLEVSFPEGEPAHEVLAKVWARRKIEDLSEQLMVCGDAGPLEEEITDLALHYKLLSAYTSFVAIDEADAASPGDARPPRRMLVPVPLPEGVSFEGVFGGEKDLEESFDKIAGLADRKTRLPHPGRDAFARKEERASGSLRSSNVSATPAPYPSSQVLAQMAAPGAVPSAPLPLGVGGGVVGGVVGGMPGGAGGAKPAAPPATLPPLTATAEAVEAEALRADETLALRTRATEQHAEAAKALSRARELRAGKDWEGARKELQLAYLIKEAVLRIQPWADDGTRLALAEEWDAVEKDRSALATRTLPALARRLDLVVRNSDLEPALDAIARASGVPVRIVPGSIEDAAELLDADRLRVAYLDLRGATTAQGLTWLLQPKGLEWRIEAGTVVVSSARRGLGVSAWAYRVGDLVRSAAAGAAKDPAERAFREFEQTVRSALAPARASLLSPDLLLVHGDTNTQTRAAELLAALRAKRPSPAASPAERARAIAAARAAMALHEFSWSLLAAALQGRTDDEAVSELLEAWSTPGLGESLAKAGSTLALRSLWAIAEARAVAPQDAALANLSQLALKSLSDEGPGAGSGEASSIYLRLLESMPAGTLPGALPHRPGQPRQPSDPMTAVASVLSASAATGHAETILKALDEGRLRGDDPVVLAAVALKRAGGASWTAFLQKKADLARSAGVSGGALRVINRLDGAVLAALRRS